jgi:hypothetical protein
MPAERIAGRHACSAVDDTQPSTMWVRRFVAYCTRKRALVEGLNRDSAMFHEARNAMYATRAPLLARAQAFGDARDDVEIYDVMHLVTGLMSVSYKTDEQRERVLMVALDSIRPQVGVPS